MAETKREADDVIENATEGDYVYVCLSNDKWGDYVRIIMETSADCPAGYITTKSTYDNVIYFVKKGTLIKYHLRAFVEPLVVDMTPAPNKEFLL